MMSGTSGRLAARLGLYVLAAASQPVVRVTTSGAPVWVTATVAVGAALLGSLVGGLVSYRVNAALDDRRRRARSQVRRKAKIYTPIRAELVALRDALDNGKQFGSWGIVREIPPPVINRPASLHLWKDLIEDGRAETAASQRVRDLLGDVETKADDFNNSRAAVRDVFEERGAEILASLGHEVRLLNWVDVDLGQLVNEQFKKLSILGLDFDEPLPKKVRREFERAWTADVDIAEGRSDLVTKDQALRVSVAAAIAELESAMRRISRRYENESDED